MKIGNLKFVTAFVNHRTHGVYFIANCFIDSRTEGERIDYNHLFKNDKPIQEMRKLKNNYIDLQKYFLKQYYNKK